MQDFRHRKQPQHFSELEGREQEFLAFCEELLPDLSQYSEPVAQTIRFIQKNYGENISLNDASEAVHLNAAYLSFVFHKETEITFSEYLTACRINRAKELLLQTDEKVKEIGRQAGYRDNRAFLQNVQACDRHDTAGVSQTQCIILEVYLCRYYKQPRYFYHGCFSFAKIKKG